MAWTCTLQTKRPHGRTHTGARRCPGDCPHPIAPSLAERALPLASGGRGYRRTPERPIQTCSEFPYKTNHVFIIVDGEAEFVTGGKMTDPKVISPGQTRGTGIEGGVVHHLSKGDVITIPANTPHWWKDTSKTGSVGYYAVNFEQ